MKPELLQALNAITTHEEIKEAWEFLRQKNQRLATVLVDKFQIGQKVRFQGRRGTMLEGTVTKLNQRTVSVEVVVGSFPVTWKVASTLVTPVE